MKTCVNAVQAVGSFSPPNRVLSSSSGNLTVINLTPEDHGVYECVAASVVSSVITTTLLIIERTLRIRAPDISPEHISPGHVAPGRFPRPDNSRPFLSRVSILTRDIDIANLSVCPSVTFRYQMKTA